MNGQQPRVVIIGGGFGGLKAAQALRRAPVRVTLIDRHNHHLFQPLLYQVATAALIPSDIASPIRRILRGQRNVEVVLADGRGDRPSAAKKVVLADGDPIAYDYLIVATGATHSYFGHDEWERDAPGLKSIADALEIRRRVLSAFEAAEREPDPARRRAWLTFVIVGAGPTGVELAGALGEIARHALAKDFRHIDPTQAHVILLEGSPRVLPSYVAVAVGEGPRAARRPRRRRPDRDDRDGDRRRRASASAPSGSRRARCSGRRASRRRRWRDRSACRSTARAASWSSPT